MKVLVAVALVLLLGAVSTQVIGIDLGTEFWKAALISPGKNLIIVENSRSGRKSHNGIAFLDGIRHFEYDAFIKHQKKPKSAYFYLNKLIESLDYEAPAEGFDFQDGTYWFKGGQERISLEQLVGMIMKNIKKYSSSQAGSDIKDAVMTVPAHWGFKARMALVNAAYLADLSILGLIKENTAAAVHYAITRNDTEPINVGFFNLGGYNLQMSIIQFFGTLDQVKQKNIESMRVLSHVSVPNAGGSVLAQYIAEHVAAQFRKKHSVDIKSSEKAWTKLFRKCSGLIEVLSANKEGNIFIEGLIDGLDLNMNIKRDVLEASGVFDKIVPALESAIEQAGISKEEVQSVEVIGGTSRIPKVHRILKEFFDPIEVGAHINGDEAMAFGAALRAANLSIAFRVKQLHLYDGFPEPVKVVVSSEEDGVVAEKELFDQNSPQGLKKDITIDQNDKDLSVKILYGSESVHEYKLTNLSQWKEKYDENELNFTEPPKVILTFAAHSIDIAELKEAYVNITLNTSTTKEVYETVMENVTVQQTEQSKPKEGEEQNKEESDKEERTGDEGSAEEDKDEEKQAQQTAQEKTDQSQPKKEEQQAEDRDENGESGDEKEEKSQDKPKKKRTRQRSRSVKKIVDDFKIEVKKYSLKREHVFAKYPRFTKEVIQDLKAIGQKFEKHENYLKEKSKLRNDFESTLYALKGDFDSPGLKTWSTEEEMEKLKEAVVTELEWFDENAWTAEKDEFQKHYRSIQEIYTPIVNRSQEYKERQTIYNKTVEILSLVYSKTVELNSTQPWVSQKALDHLKKLNDTMEWIHDKLKEQVNRKPYEPIVFYNQEMIDKAEDLRDEYYLIKMIPRPKAPKKPKEEPNKEQTQQAKTQNEGTNNEAQEEQPKQEPSKEDEDKPKQQDL